MDTLRLTFLIEYTTTKPATMMQGAWDAFLRDGKALAGFLPYFMRNKPGFAVISDGRTGWLLRHRSNEYRLRVLGSKGIAFSPARSRGTGRHAAPKHLRAAFGEVDGFIVAEFVRPGRKIRLWKVTIEDLWWAYREMVMSRSGFVARSKLNFGIDTVASV